MESINNDEKNVTMEIVNNSESFLDRETTSGEMGTLSSEGKTDETESTSAMETVDSDENTATEAVNSDEKSIGIEITNSERTIVKETVNNDDSKTAVDVDSSNETATVKETINSDESETSVDAENSNESEAVCQAVSSSVSNDITGSIDDDDDETRVASDDNMEFGSVAVDSSANCISDALKCPSESKTEPVLPFQTLAVEMEESGAGQSSSDAALSESFENINEKVSDTLDNFPTDDSVTNQSGIFEEKGDTELIPEGDIKQEPTTHIEDFLFAPASSFSQNKDKPNSEEKRLALRKFPTIVRAIETADYELLQALYLLLYLRNAWDTEKILIQGILDFSGFDCEIDSEDFYTRKLNLCTLSNDVLYKIKNLLGIQSSWSFNPNSISANSGSEQAKLDVVQKILNFLHRPMRKSRPRKPRRNSGSSRQRSKGKKRSRVSKKVNKDTEKSSSEVEEISHKVGLANIKPGPLIFKLKSYGLDGDELLEVERSLKEQIAKGNAAQIRVILEKLDQRALAEKLKMQTSASATSSVTPSPVPTPPPPSELLPAPFVPVHAPSLASLLTQSSSSNPDESYMPVKTEIIEEEEEIVVEKKKEEEKLVEEEEKKEENIVEKKNEEEKIIEKDKVVVVVEKEKNEETTENKDKTTAPDSLPVVKKKLKDFPLVLSCIEGTPEKLLIELYFLLFLIRRNHEIDEIKEKILEFNGFSFSEDSEDFKNRKSVLNLMSESMVKDIARSLYLDPKSDKSATEIHLLNFLKQPAEHLLRPTVVAPGMLADVELDIEGLSDTDSDDSISYEVVEKKVECVDLLSSDEEDKGLLKKALQITTPVMKAAINLPQPLLPPLLLTTATTSTTVVTPETVPSPAAETHGSAVRTLRDFVTIKKIVETHPNEYLVDIYNLLYMKNCQPENLRKDILDFGGFEFDKTSPDYTKRKLFLDRMLYNSVRRIYNTLIHNTREVKVFSKPTMIGEIFQFLLKLPDHDTSVPPPRPQTVTKTVTNYPSLTSVISTETIQNKEQQAMKLSDLKRVFQRVACFPCEYLVDVHKLLFMTDCDMKDIRANIFNFKGFTFAVGSPEFNQRKMFLEYLTFHSLRKISSVLTTKTVDMRNSTKHELASHLTEVLKEYTTMQYEPEPEKSETSENTTPAVEENNTKNETSISSDSGVEQIVVTPIILPLETNPLSPDRCEDMDVTVSSSTSSDNSKTTNRSPSKLSSKASVDSMCTSSTSKTSSQLVSSGSSRKGVDSPQIRTDSPSSSTPASKPESQKPAKTKTGNKKRKATESAAQAKQNMQFADINLPDIEKYRKIYPTNISILKNPNSSPREEQVILPPGNMPSSTTLNYQPDFMFPHLPHSIAMRPPPNMARPMITTNMQQQMKPFIHSMGPPPMTRIMAPNTQLPLMHSFPQRMPMQNPAYFVQSPSYLKMDNNPDTVSIPVECILQEGNAITMPGPKRFKQMGSKYPERLSGNEEALLRAVQLEKGEIENPSSSIQLKIRDAMTKTLEDEEDCDKPLATLVGHPNDRVLKQQICEIVENTDLQDISMNGVIQKIFNMYPKYDLKYRKEFIKSTLRSLLYRLGDTDSKKDLSPNESDSSKVTTTNKQKSNSSSMQRPTRS